MILIHYIINGKCEKKFLLINIYYDINDKIFDKLYSEHEKKKRIRGETI